MFQMTCLITTGRTSLPTTDLTPTSAQSTRKAVGGTTTAPMPCPPGSTIAGDPTPLPGDTTTAYIGRTGKDMDILSSLYP